MKVFYNPKQSVESNKSFSPSAGKPRAAVDSWKQKFPIELCDFTPLTVDQLKLAHDSKMVDGILNLEIENGFGNTSSEVAASLPYTSGSIYAAAKYAYEHKTIACSPTSGFHHAGYNYNGGFCTLNGLMIAAQILQLEDGVELVGIIDCDNHFGDGTVDIIQKLELRNVIHYTYGANRIKNEKEWLLDFEKRIEDFKHCDVVIYQAGADPHVDDPLGGNLTTRAMRKRDDIAFRLYERYDVPMAWNLAGGYQTPLRKVLDLHDYTMESAIKSLERKKETWQKIKEQVTKYQNLLIKHFGLLGAHTANLFQFLLAKKRNKGSNS